MDTKDTIQKTLGDNSTVKATLRHNITLLQTACGLSDDTLSWLIAGDHVTLHKLKNTGDITPAHLTRLCHIFGVIPHDLLFTTLTMPPDYTRARDQDSVTDDTRLLTLLTEVAHIPQAKDKDVLCYLARRLRGDPHNESDQTEAP